MLGVGQHRLAAGRRHVLHHRPIRPATDTWLAAATVTRASRSRPRQAGAVHRLHRPSADRTLGSATCPWTRRPPPASPSPTATTHAAGLARFRAPPPRAGRFGTCSITADQAGDATWLAAATVTQSFAVTPAASARHLAVHQEPVAPRQAGSRPGRRLGGRSARAPRPASGRIALVEGGAEIGSGNLDANGKAEVVLSRLDRRRPCYHGALRWRRAYAPAQSPVLIQERRGPRHRRAGGDAGERDARFSFVGSRQTAHVVVGTSGGRGESAPVRLPAGRYSVQLEDARKERLPARRHRLLGNERIGRPRHGPRQLRRRL